MLILVLTLPVKKLVMILPNAKHETKVCPRCQGHFICKVGDVTNCQCSTVQLKEAAQKHIQEVYADCLCAHCLQHLTDQLSPE